MRSLAFAAGLLVLGACSSGDEAPAVPQGEPSASAAPTTSVTPPAEIAEIPPAFLGAWDYVEGKCLSYSDALMTVKPGEITFYESYGKVTGVVQDSPQSVTVALDMAGEGEQWTQSLVLTLTDGGNGMTSQSEGAEPFPHKRCATVLDAPPE